MTNNPDMQPTVTEALKPCPFCGSDAMRLIEVSPLHEGKFRVSHDHAITGFDCYVSGPIRVGEAAAIAAWNTRQHSVDGRSEEHTSELQSLMRISYAVFCFKQKNDTEHSLLITTNIIHTHLTIPFS